jgi:hypothetical protein
MNTPSQVLTTTAPTFTAPNVQLEPTTTEAGRYHAILERAVGEGARRAADVIAAIQRDQPRDQILRVSAARFALSSAGALEVLVGDDHYKPTDFALGQIAARAAIPLPYLRDLVNSKAPQWQHDLAVEILGCHYGNAGYARLLARSVGGQLRGWLSDRYRRLDSRPLLDALAAEAKDLGALPIDAVATETRVAFKIALPEIVEPIPGEFLVYGGEWSNSDVGNGVHSFRMFALRVACLNGLTTENVLRQVHLGGRLISELQFSERTYRLDTATSVSALRDVVRSALGPSGRDTLTATIRAAHERRMTTPQLALTTRTLPKALQRAIGDAFDSQDVINLPAGQTAWRASNAISWVARHTEDAELRLDLERSAGSIL